MNKRRNCSFSPERESEQFLFCYRVFIFPERRISLKLGTSRNQSFSGLVALIFGEVLDESSCQIFGLGLPFGSIRVGISGIQNVGVYTRKLGGYFNVEVRNLLGGSFQDVAVQDGRR